MRWFAGFSPKQVRDIMTNRARQDVMEQVEQAALPIWITYMKT
jgi:membrane carboxypeptidase/penicillin-binding protein